MRSIERIVKECNIDNENILSRSSKNILMQNESEHWKTRIKIVKWESEVKGEFFPVGHVHTKTIKISNERVKGICYNLVVFWGEL